MYRLGFYDPRIADALDRNFVVCGQSAVHEKLEHLRAKHVGVAKGEKENRRHAQNSYDGFDGVSGDGMEYLPMSAAR